MVKTKVDQQLADAERAHQNDPERAELIRRVRRFKASWIELAEELSLVRRRERWRGWGYESFEAYVRSELHLKPETADKLAGAYVYLQRSAPAVLRRDALSEPVPSYLSVDFVRRAEERGTAETATLEAVRRMALDEGASAGALSRAYGDAVFPIEPAARRAREVAGLKNVAGRLRELLSETHAVAPKLAREVSGALDKLLAELTARDGKAA
ncbi:MAG: hypothetical protein ABTD50_11660 [Polyangiaceae bacterium]|jgi:hypothetical protein